MRLEQLPLLLGILVAIVGLGLILDAQLPEGFAPSRERRRRERAERHRIGETLVGLGILCLAAALIGRDTWRFGTVSVLLGVVFLGAGGWLNRTYFRELLVFRGPSRRGEKRMDPARRARAGSARRPLADVVTSQAAAVPGSEGPVADRERAARGTSPVRGDREAPIITASEGIPRGSSKTGDEPGGGAPRPRIR